MTEAEWLVSEDPRKMLHAVIPKEIVPFACDGGGSTVQLDFTPAGKGRVVAFVMRLPEWASQRQDSQFIEIAGSFSEYVDKLYVDEEEIRDELDDGRCGRQLEAVARNRISRLANAFRRPD